MVYKPETYEERADHAEWQVQELEGMLFTFHATVEEDSEEALAELRKRWEQYLEETS